MKEQPRLRYEADTIAKYRQENITQHQTGAGHYTPPHGGTNTTQYQHATSRSRLEPALEYEVCCANADHSLRAGAVEGSPITMTLSLVDHTRGEALSRGLVMMCGHP